METPGHLVKLANMPSLLNIHDILYTKYDTKYSHIFSELNTITAKC